MIQIKKTIELKEGVPDCYYEIPVTVELKYGTPKEAKTFVVCKDKEKEYFIRPIKEYMEEIIKGARNFGLSEKWIKKLEQIPTI